MYNVTKCVVSVKCNERLLSSRHRALDLIYVARTQLNSILHLYLFIFIKPMKPLKYFVVHFPTRYRCSGGFDTFRVFDTKNIAHLSTSPHSSHAMSRIIIAEAFWINCFVCVSIKLHTAAQSSPVIFSFYAATLGNPPGGYLLNCT